MTWHVYIALLKDGRFYVGITHPSASAAQRRERQLKGWSHAKKQALIDGDLAGLKALSRRRRT